jgi:hypothetical protein
MLIKLSVDIALRSHICKPTITTEIKHPIKHKEFIINIIT